MEVSIRDNYTNEEMIRKLKGRMIASVFKSKEYLPLLPSNVLARAWLALRPANECLKVQRLCFSIAASVAAPT